MKKRFLALALAFTMVVSLFSSNLFAYASESLVKIIVNGELIESDVDAYVNDDSRTMVPIRFVSEALGATVSWDSETQTVTVVKDDSTMILTVGSVTYTLNDTTMTMDTKLVIVDDRTMVPVRFVSEALGNTVDWDESNSTVLIGDDTFNGEGGMMGPEDGMMGSEGGPMNGQTESTYTVEEANAIEEELVAAIGYTAAVDGYPIVDTNQTLFFSNDAIIDEPAEGEDFYGQDASYTGNAPSYTDNGDGTVTDNVTGLMWQQDPGEKLTWAEAVEYLDEFNEEALGGYSDWRIPTIKELYSLVDFSGKTRTSSDTSIPYINTDYFVFLYGDQAGEPRFIDSQILTTTIYNSTTLGGNTTVFGYNFADGRIKGYEIDKDFYCYFVRGNTNYGQNLFVDNGDETITDEATSLMWSQNDSGYYEAGTEGDGTLNWQEALEWVQEMNDEELLGYSDWRLPNIKELQSLADYSKSTIVDGTPSIDDLLYCTPIINAFGQDDYGYYWSGTTHNDTSASVIEYNAASYMVFGRAMGEMNGEVVDAHGSGSQKSDPKTGDREDYPVSDENAPQGDEQRVYNMVRLVRDAE
jgi:hypothetical protein